MLRTLIKALENTTVVHDDREAVRLLLASGCPTDLIDVFGSLLGDGSVVLRSNGERLVLYWVGDDWEAWFEGEPTGLRCLYRH